MWEEGEYCWKKVGLKQGLALCRCCLSTPGPGMLGEGTELSCNKGGQQSHTTSGQRMTELALDMWWMDVNVRDGREEFGKSAVYSSPVSKELA